MHLVQVDDPKNYRPYDLLVIDPPQDPSLEHYTMTPAGIVHICPGEPSECIPLAVWMRQSIMFNILRRIPFYQFYLHRKAFTIWRENVRFQLYVKQRKRISDRYFLVRKTTCAPIIEIKKHLLDIQNVKLLHFDLRSCDKNVFMDQQNSTLQQASGQFEESIRKIITETQNVIVEVTTLHTNVMQEDDGPAFNDGGNTEKAKSLVKLIQEKQERKQTKLRAIFEYNTLPDFIRLVDYLTVECLVTLTINAAHAFNEELLKVRKVGIFETTIRFTETTTVFSPTCNEIKEMLEKLLDSMVSAVSNVNRVGYLSTKHENSTSGPNIQQIIRENMRFKKIAALIQQKIISDFERANEHVQTFESVRPIYLFNAKWDFNAYKSEHHELSSLKNMLEHIINWNKELDKLRNKPIGVLEVDSKRLKGELHPMREARLAEIKEYMRDIASEKCSQLLDLFKENLIKLSAKASHLKDFAGFVQTLNSLREEEKSSLKAASQVDQIYNILQIYEVQVPPEHLVAHEDLHERLHEYKREMDAAVSFKESKLSEMTNHLDMNIFKLSEQVATVASKLNDAPFTDKSYFDNADNVLEEMAQLGQKIDAIDQLGNTYSNYQKLFNSNVSDYSDIAACKQRWNDLKHLWELVKNWNSKYYVWMNTQFLNLSVDDIDRDVQVFFKDSFNLHKKINNKVSETLKDRIAEFKAIMPNVLDLGNPKMRARHWVRVLGKIDMNYVEGMPLCLQQMLNAGIMDHKDFVQEMSATASGEAQLEDSLNKIQQGWEKIEFIVLNHRDQHGLFILGTVEEIVALLEDNQVTLQTMLGSRFITGIRDNVEIWEKKLALLSETLDEWLMCQKNWMYLENIFGAEDIQKQLPAESQKFLVVDRSWKTIMNRTREKPLVTNALIPLDNGMALLDQFVMNNAALESIQKSLEQYLETKRMAFPRFYFLSNDELLEILSQTRDPHAVQPHMGKCFDAIKRIKFGEGRHAHDILGFIDPGGEVVSLSESVKAEGPVECWLLAFEKAMRTTLYDQCKKAYTEYPSTEEGAINRKEWLWSSAAQVVIAVDQVLWTQNCAKALYLLEKGFNDEAMQNFLDFSLKQIDAMVDLVRQPLSKLQRTLLGALLTIDVHARDVVRAMVHKDTRSLTDFEWTKQLRYYWDEAADDIIVKQTNSKFPYGYEYLGNGPRLVITPLTDTCYMTLTGALHMRLGGMLCAMHYCNIFTCYRSPGWPSWNW